MISNRGKPEWLKILPPTEKFVDVREILKGNKLHTVCEESHCPNISECWSGGTATFMVMGDVCTRGCKFCNVQMGFPARPLDANEPENLAKAIGQMNLDYVVITSVDRDDLPDPGAGHFAECITKIKEARPNILVEVLIPDFRGKNELIKKVIDAKPDVIAHNVETVARLQGKVRDPRANYKQSLGVLKFVKEQSEKIYTKSSLILGFGEKDEEVLQTLHDLRAIEVDVVTMGQYLRPSDWHLPVLEYVPPQKFDHFKLQAERMGFLYCASGPFVRSSYRAGELFIKNVLLANREKNASTEVKVES